MNKTSIVNAVRKMVVDASGIDAAQNMKVFGVTFDPTGKRLWAEEFVTGGETVRISRERVRISGMIMEYHFCSHAGNSTEEAMQMLNRCTDSIMPDMRINVPGTDAFVEKVKTERSESKDWNIVKLIITVSATDIG